MAKRKMFNIYSLNDVPDHITEEYMQFLQKLGKTIQPILSESEPNYGLSAMIQLLAMFLCHSVIDDPEEIKRAALLCAKNIIKNVEFYSKVEILDE